MRNKYIHFFENNKSITFWRKILHSYLTPQFLWQWVIQDYNHSQKIQNKRLLKLKWLLKKIFWFWPTLNDSFFWENVAVGDIMGPQDYMEIAPHSKILVNELLERCNDKNCSFLELGCNRGRFLNILFESGMRNIEGVDICVSAIDCLKSENPELFLNQSIHLKTIQEFLLEKDSFSVDVVYTHGATVELIPSSFPLVKEICRVAKDSVIFYISESNYLYPRFWRNEFSKYNFRLIKLVRPSKNSLHSLTLFIFERF
jgi:SAM-dependent methyltransferase